METRILSNATGSDAVVLGSWYRASGYLYNIFEVIISTVLYKLKLKYYIYVVLLSCLFGIRA